MGTEYVRLVDKCVACTTALNSHVSNMESFDMLIYLFMAKSAVIFSRFTKTTEISPLKDPTIHSNFLYIYIYLLGIAIGLILIISEFFEFIRVIMIIYYKRYNKNIDEDNTIEIRSNGMITLYKTRIKFIRWDTRNIYLEKIQPIQCFKWFIKSSDMERVLHSMLTSRSLFASYAIICTYIIKYILLYNNNKLWDIIFYYFTIQELNGMAIGLLLTLIIKILYNIIIFIIYLINNNLYNKYFINNNIIDFPIFIYLKDGCPCKYIINNEHKLKKYYFNSTNTHALYNKFYKFINLFIFIIITIFIFIEIIIILFNIINI